MNAKAVVTPVILIFLSSVLFAGLATMNVAAQGDPLGQAVDNPNLPWATGGTITTYTYYGGQYSTQTSTTAGWYSESSAWLSGGSAAECHVYAYTQGLHTGVLNDKVYLKTVVNGPGTLSFWWKLNASTSACNVSFCVDGNALKVLSMNPTASNPPSWTSVTVPIGPGQHTAAWEASAVPSAGHITSGYANVDTVTWAKGSSLRLQQ